MRFEDLVAKEAGDKKDEVVARFFAETGGGKAGFPRFQEWAIVSHTAPLYLHIEKPLMAKFLLVLKDLRRSPGLS